MRPPHIQIGSINTRTIGRPLFYLYFTMEMDSKKKNFSSYGFLRKDIIIVVTRPVQN